MVYDAFFLALGTGVAAISPVEWLIHKYLLHDKKNKLGILSRYPTHAHDAVHHVAYSDAEHYYRDQTNEDIEIHFNNGNRVSIGVLAAGAGVGLNKIYQSVALHTPASSIDASDAAAALGFVLAAGTGYLLYETTHHYMHVIGKRRKMINEEFGKRLEAEPSGRLRFSKPALDYFCNEVEQYVDATVHRKAPAPFRVTGSLERKLSEQITYNKNELGIAMYDPPLPKILEEVASAVRDREQEIIDGQHSASDRLGYKWERTMSRLFRGSDTLFGRHFRHIDNHHFLHHFSYRNNLNVGWTWADRVFGTMIDSSPAALDAQKKWWICPHPREDERFSRETLRLEPKDSVQE